MRSDHEKKWAAAENAKVHAILVPENVLAVQLLAERVEVASWLPAMASRGELPSP